jgi:lipopolysaccharide transport protein LptA
MKFFLTLLMAVNGGLIWAQTNAPAQRPPEQQIVISSNSGHFDGINHQAVYLGDVMVTDATSKLQCDRLTMYLPADGGRPTNIVAETNVVIDMLDDKGQTNHITAGKAVYDYRVVNAVTNEIVTFTGGNPSPKVESPQYTIWGDPLILDLATKQYSGTNYHMIYKLPSGSGNGTNAPGKLF